MREPTVRLRLEATNPGQFFACCGMLELAHRLWCGAEGWFEPAVDFFCVAPLRASSRQDASAIGVLHALRASSLASATMTAAELQRHQSLASKRKLTRPEADEKTALDAVWERAKHDTLVLGAPFHLRLDWYLDDRAGGARFKTWAGRQTVAQLAAEVKAAADAASLDTEQDLLFAEIPCPSGAFNFDAEGGGSDLDVGFSFDPLGIGAPRKRVLVHLLTFIGLQRFRPRQRGTENSYAYAAWLDPLGPEVASAAASGSMPAARARRFEFALLYRTKYLKSFLPAVPRGDDE